MFIFVSLLFFYSSSLFFFGGGEDFEAPGIYPPAVSSTFLRFLTAQVDIGFVQVPVN